MDKLLRKIGLSGRSIVPLLIGFGCTVPAVMSTRTLPSDRDRKMTILLTPFMSCTAKLPIYSFFVAAFFPENGWIVITALYFLGIVLGIFALLCWRNQGIHVISDEQFTYTTMFGNTRTYYFSDIQGLRRNQDSLTLFVANEKVHIESMAVISERLAENINKALEKLN
jgi:hypothetical protein